MSDLQICNMSHFRGNKEEAAKFAERDDWTYTVDRILRHRPSGVRRRRPKRDYEFEVLWAHLPLEEDSNPSWEPWSNTSLRSCEAYSTYLQQPDVVAALGNDFYAGEADAELDADPTEREYKRQRKR